MSITIDATAGGSAANSFVTEAQFIAYLATRLNVPTGSTVSGTSCTETEKAALIEAARDLSARDYVGVRVSTTQALAWPRWDARNPDGPYDTSYFTQTEIPTRVATAQMELALQYLKAGATDLAVADTNGGVIRKKVDVLETEWAPGQRPTGLARFSRVWEQLAPLVAGGGSSWCRA